MAGLDLIGDNIVEVNVFSPSGLQQYDLHFDGQVSVQVVQQLLEHPLS